MVCKCSALLCGRAASDDHEADLSFHRQLRTAQGGTSTTALEYQSEAKLEQIKA
jgi:hypothetical protein